MLKKYFFYFNIIIISLLLICPSISSAEWEKMKENSERKSAVYIDKERIRKVDNYVYWWELLNFQQAQRVGGNRNSYFSAIVYWQGDCRIFRKKVLNVHWHEKPMGQGIRKTVVPTSGSTEKSEQWRYPSPNSLIERDLKFICVTAK